MRTFLAFVDQTRYVLYVDLCAKSAISTKRRCRQHVVCLLITIPSPSCLNGLGTIYFVPVLTDKKKSVYFYHGIGTCHKMLVDLLLIVPLFEPSNAFLTKDPTSSRTSTIFNRMKCADNFEGLYEFDRG